jgi:predicted ATPase
VQITNFQIGNYKSYNEPVQFEFCSGINVITGQNNAGKTALLEGISARFEGNPHRSPRTVPTRNSPVRKQSRIEVTFRLTVDEVKDCLLQMPESAQINFARPVLNTPFADSIQYRSGQNEIVQGEQLLAWFWRQSQHDFRLALERNGQGNPVWQVARVPPLGTIKRSGRPAKMSRSSTR